MPRAPFQTLTIPYRLNGSNIEYAVFKRADDANWQAVAGGGEDNETPLVTAKREVMEEIGVTDGEFLPLASLSSVPAKFFSKHNWDKNIMAVPEFCFGMKLDKQDIVISHEHSEYKWVSYEEAIKLLTWDSNKTALWELNSRLVNKLNDIDINKNIFRKYI